MKEIVFSLHALQQIAERGTSQEEVIQAIREGQRQPARAGRHIFRLNLEYNAEWAGKHYGAKQVAPVVVEEGDRVVVITVYTFFF
ncbi:MAG: DUF4258 domain-containing protein [Phycisphaerae bacterium]